MEKVKKSVMEQVTKLIMEQVTKLIIEKVTKLFFFRTFREFPLVFWCIQMIFQTNQKPARLKTIFFLMYLYVSDMSLCVLVK